MSKEFEDVIRFNQEVIKLRTTEVLNQERLDWFNKVINEELGEFNEANARYTKACVQAAITGKGINEDLVHKMKSDMIDAIIDLIYFAYGRLYEIGVTPEEFDCMWNAVQKANMSKVKGNKGRGSDDDAIKPEGWQSPEAAYINFKKAQNDSNKQLDSDLQTPCDEFSQLSLFNTQSLNNTNTENNKLNQDKLIVSMKELEQGLVNLNDLKITAGAKYDNDKPNLSLVLGGFPKALLEVGEIGTFGAKKYSPNGWKYVLNLQERYTSALLRHLFAIFCNEDIDRETGRLHLCHIAWNALALAEDKLDKLTPSEYINYKNIAKAIEQAYFKAKKEQNNG